MAAKTTGGADSTAPVLPETGFLTEQQTLLFFPYGRETLRKLIRAGKAPQPTYFSKVCKGFRAEDIREYLRDPLNYTAESIAQVPA
jgi:prophage regulatory protein